MPSESQMSERLMSSLKTYGLDPLRIENRIHAGTPDVNYIKGWLELKHADRWPPRGGPLRLKHPPTPQQKVWLYRRWNSGGTAFLVLRVDKEWFIIRGIDVLGLWQDNDPYENEVRVTAIFQAEHPDHVARFLKDYER